MDGIDFAIIISRFGYLIDKHIIDLKCGMTLL